MIKFGYMQNGILRNSEFFAEPIEYDFARVNRYKGIHTLLKKNIIIKKLCMKNFIIVLKHT